MSLSEQYLATLTKNQRKLVRDHKSGAHLGPFVIDECPLCGEVQPPMNPSY